MEHKEEQEMHHGPEEEKHRPEDEFGEGSHHGPGEGHHGPPHSHPDDEFGPGSHHGPGEEHHGPHGPHSHHEEEFGEPWRRMGMGEIGMGTMGIDPWRHFVSREEIIARLEGYLKQLQLEEKGVSERIEELKKPGQPVEIKKSTHKPG